MKTYLVMANAFLYIDADSPDDAEKKAELANLDEWDLQDFSAAEDNSWEVI